MCVSIVANFLNNKSESCVFLDAVLAGKAKELLMYKKYYHDVERETVYAMDLPPQVREEKKKLKRTGWFVSATITITRADNFVLPRSQQWKYPVRDYPYQSFDAHYTQEDVIDYFLAHHEPKCQEIDCATYERLHAEYEARAKMNHV